MLNLKNAPAFLILGALSFGCQNDKSDSAEAPTTNIQPGDEVSNAVANGTATDAANVASDVIQCSYSFNGKTVQGNSQEECDKLKLEYGQGLEEELPSVPVVVLPGAPSTPEIPTDAVTQISCSFNVNGKLSQGTTAAECEKLQEELGLSF